MGNKGSTPQVKSPDEIREDFDKAMNPNRNGFLKKLDPAQNGFTNAFKKGGAIPDFLKKVGDQAVPIGDMYQKIGGGLLTAGTLMDATGIGAVAGVPLQVIGGAMGTAGTLTKKLGSSSKAIASTLEKPKREFNPSQDLPNIIFS